MIDLVRMMILFKMGSKFLSPKCVLTYLLQCDRDMLLDAALFLWDKFRSMYTRLEKENRSHVTVCIECDPAPPLPQLPHVCNAEWEILREIFNLIAYKN